MQHMDVVILIAKCHDELNALDGDSLMAKQAILADYAEQILNGRSSAKASMKAEKKKAKK